MIVVKVYRESLKAYLSGVRTIATVEEQDQEKHILLYPYLCLLLSVVKMERI